MIRQAGGRATVLALADAWSDDDKAALGDSELVTAHVGGPDRFGYAPRLATLLDAADPDLLHLHGIWMYPSRAGEAWARRTGRPYLISPHGMLDPWITARGRWKKSLARAAYERASWRRADAFHALTEAEAVDIRREAGAKRVWTIANAGPAAAGKVTARRRPRVVYLGRIHPKKNLAALVEAWRSATLPAAAELAIAGWGAPGEIAALEALLRPGDAIHFLGPVHGDAKRRLLDEARYLVLPSHSEGLPMTVLEAWAAGTPTIMTAACHLPDGYRAGAALECGTAASSITESLTRALAMDEPRWRVMSEAALALARGPYSAATIQRQWTKAYLTLCRGIVA